MRAYYNEFEAYPAQWLRNLAGAGHIAPGRIDERSILDVRAADLAGSTQCHFFAGIGVWDAALRMAGWPDDRAVWTGSCPCQPFSDAGGRQGFVDKRHLWPAWFDLIRECKPPTIFGEQVASPSALVWLDTVFADLESEGYACAAADLCAASVGAPHRRQRLFFVAYAGQQRCRKLAPTRLHDQGTRGNDTARRGARGLGDTDSCGAGQHTRAVPCDESEHGERAANSDHALVATSAARDVGDTVGARWETRQPTVAQNSRRQNERGVTEFPGAAPTTGFWANADWISCSDGISRPVEPGTFPLAARTPNRVGRLRAYGNSIVPQVASAFITAAEAARSVHVRAAVRRTDT